MRILIAVDWSDEAFSAVRAALELYRPQELILLHAVDLRPFDNPVLAPAVAKQALEEFQRAMENAGHQLLDRTAELVPKEVHLTRLQEFGRPAPIILDAIDKMRPDLIVLGSRGRGRIGELALGSVSHRILLHAPCSTLIVKGPMAGLRRALVAVQGFEDAERIQGWLKAHPFNEPVDLTIISAVPTPHLMEPAPLPPFEPWDTAAVAAAQDLVKDLAAVFTDDRYKATGHVFRGDPPAIIEREASQADLVIVGSHGRTGVQRFLIGSVSHAITHRVACPILIVR